MTRADKALAAMGLTAVIEPEAAPKVSGLLSFTVDAKELKGALALLKGIVQKRNTMPVLSHVLISTEGGCITLTASDIETSLRMSIPAQVHGEGASCLPAIQLFNIAMAAKKAPITITMQDTQWALITTGGISTRLACLEDVEFPMWPELKDAIGFNMPSDSFMRITSRVLYFAGESDTRYTLNGLLFEVKDGAFTVVGTDGHRMAVQPAGYGMPHDFRIIVPGQSISAIRRSITKRKYKGVVEFRLAVKPEKPALKDGYLEAYLGDRILCRLIDGTYPNYLQVIGEDKDYKEITLNAAKLTEILTPMNIISKTRSNTIGARIEGNTLHLTASNPDIGEAAASMEISNPMNVSIRFGFNARYIFDALNSLDTIMSIRWGFHMKNHSRKVEHEIAKAAENGAEFEPDKMAYIEPMRFRPLDTASDGLLCIVMPIRI